MLFDEGPSMYLPTHQLSHNPCYRGHALRQEPTNWWVRLEEVIIPVIVDMLFDKQRSMQIGNRQYNGHNPCYRGHALRPTQG